MWISYNIDFKQIISILARADKTYLFLAFILSLAQIFIASLRFYFFLCAAETKVRLSKCIEAVMKAIAYNSFIPSKGGDLLKAFVLSSQKSKIIRITGVAIVERIVDLFVVILISLVGLLVIDQYKYAIISVLLLCSLCIILFILKRIKQLPLIKQKLYSIKDLDNIFITNWKSSIIAVISSFFFWFINLLIIILLLKSVGLNLAYFKIFAYWPFAMVSGILPLSISGFGTRDGVFVYLLDNPQFTEPILTATFLYTILLYWLLSLISLLLLTVINFYNCEKN